MDTLESVFPSADVKCAFIFAHYDDAALNVSKVLDSCPPGSIDMVLCSAVPSGRLNSLRQMQLPSRIRRSRASILLNHAILGRPVYGEWDDHCGFSVSTQEVMRERSAEHDRVCSLFDVDSFGLDVLDSQYGRSGRKGEEKALARALDLVRDREIGAVVTHPLDAQHPDHAKAVKLALAVCKSAGTSLVTACERPYTVCSAAECSHRNPGYARASATVNLDDRTWKLKHEAVSCYPTQIVGLDGSFTYDWMARPHLGVECYQRIR
ncbi:PIG-L family deacetylase [Rhodococcus sp. UNC363MFTsu5.1]|uniref:PIG-L family deacetylase n=1 Tax=Rhodococcus sp. UNC363MFTsu5.1 TaxID=1449069 RepID=UPI0018CC723F|nr:PIG-L family deacetylase [Rhodococcus sp. UNC363MFTsu5.1]